MPLGAAEISPEIAEEGWQDPTESATIHLLDPGVLTEGGEEPAHLQNDDQKVGKMINFSTIAIKIANSRYNQFGTLSTAKKLSLSGFFTYF